MFSRYREIHVQTTMDPVCNGNTENAKSNYSKARSMLDANTVNEHSKADRNTLHPHIINVSKEQSMSDANAVSRERSMLDANTVKKLSKPDRNTFHCNNINMSKEQSMSDANTVNCDNNLNYSRARSILDANTVNELSKADRNTLHRNNINVLKEQSMSDANTVNCDNLRFSNSRSVIDANILNKHSHSSSICDANSWIDNYNITDDTLVDNSSPQFQPLRCDVMPGKNLNDCFCPLTFKNPDQPTDVNNILWDNYRPKINNVHTLGRPLIEILSNSEEIPTPARAS